MPVQVESIMAGDGKHYPHERQTVTLHYVGYLDRAGQKKFDSTFERGKTCNIEACICGLADRRPQPCRSAAGKDGTRSPRVVPRALAAPAANDPRRVICLTNMRVRVRLCFAGPIDPKTKKPTGRHFKFRVKSGQVVKGWDDGISQLSLGEKARITIPSGERDFTF